MDKAILSVDTKAVLNIIRDLEHQLSEYHRQDKAPAWASVLETRVDQLEKYYKSGGGEKKKEAAEVEIVAAAVAPAVAPVEGGDAASVDGSIASVEPAKPVVVKDTVDLENLASEERIYNKLRLAMNSKVATHQLSFESRVTSFALEVDRLHKLLDIRPTVSDMQQVVASVSEADKRNREAIEDLGGSVLMNTVKIAVNGEMKGIVNEINITKAINDAAIDLIKRTVNEYAVDISNIRVSTQNNFDNIIEPTLNKLSAACSENQLQLTAASKDHYKEIAALNKSLNTAIEEQEHMGIMFKRFEEDLVVKFEQLQDQLGNQNDKLRDEVRDAVAGMEASEQKNARLEDAVNELKDRLAAEQTKNAQEMEALITSLAEERQQRKMLQNMVDEITSQGNDEKIQLHEEQIKAMEQGVLDLKGSIVTFVEQSNGELEKINDYIGESKAEKETIAMELLTINNKIHKLVEEDKINKDRADGLHGKIKDMENSGLMSLKYRVETAEDNAALVKQEVASLAETLTKFIDAGQEATRKAEELDERIDELEGGISNRMNTNRDTLMEVLLDVQNEMNMNLKNVRDNIEAMAATEGNLENFYLEPPRTPRFVLDNSPGNEGQGMESTEQDAVSDSDSSHMPKRTPRTMDGQLVVGNQFGNTANIKQPNRPRNAGSYAGWGPTGGNRRVGGPETMQGGPLDNIANEVQFMGDLCINFEEISTKKKRAMSVPPSMCETVAEITQALAEKFANIADLEMVKFVVISMSNSSMPTKNDMRYDENFVINCRKSMVEEYLGAVTSLVLVHNPQPGIIRLDARSMFLSLVSKSLNMFMTKHNQVLTVGNSRLGRIKIPSCIACDRPMLDKQSLDDHQDVQRSQSMMSLSLPNGFPTNNGSDRYAADRMVHEPPKKLGEGGGGGANKPRGQGTDPRKIDLKMPRLGFAG